MAKDSKQKQEKQEEKEQKEMGKRYQEANEAALDIDMMNDVMIQTIPYPMGFKTVMESMENKMFVVPSFQRVYRWSEEQAQELVISLVRGMPIPPIYGYRNEKNQIVILDGQQRLISLYLYYKGKFIKKKRNGFINAKEEKEGFKDALKRWELKEKKYSMTYIMADTGESKKVDITYQKLNEETRRLVDFAQINIILINVDADKFKERTIYKIFANLNKGGIPLSPQELRNGIYGCPFYDMIYEVNETNPKWRQMYGGNKEKEVNKESKDIELLLKFCAFRKNIQFINDKPELQNYPKSMKMFLDQFSEQVIDFSDSEIEEYRSALLKFFDCVTDIDTQKKETLWPGLFVMAEKKNFDVVITKELCKKITDSDVYKDANTSRTSSKSDIETRLECIYEQI